MPMRPGRVWDQKRAWAVPGEAQEYVGHTAACIYPQLTGPGLIAFAMRCRGLPGRPSQERPHRPVKRGALPDRLTHHVHIPEMNGESYRLEHSRKNRQ